MSTIGILTSGGDAPGMNAAIRAVTRTAVAKGLRVIGFLGGYDGLMDGRYMDLTVENVAGIMHRGGTILETARSPRFTHRGGRELALETLHRLDVDGLITVGGDGTFRGALDFMKLGAKVIGIPCTIDNDMGCTDFTIGFDTAVNTVVDAIGKLKDTTLAHNKTTILEVMGRHCGDIALYSGLTAGAEAILIPELDLDLSLISKAVDKGLARGKHHCIIIRSEGISMSNEELAAYVEELTGDAPRVVILGYLQRGGSPTAQDRLLATLMGAEAVEHLDKGGSGLALGVWNGEVRTMPLKEAVALENQPNLDLLSLMYQLS